MAELPTSIRGAPALPASWWLEVAGVSSWSIAELADLFGRDVERDLSGGDIDSGLEIHLPSDAMPVRDGHRVGTSGIDVTVLDEFAHR